MNVEALSQLGSFNGTVHYYQHPLFVNFVYTDGLRHLAQNADAYWLIDLIAGYQTQARADASLRDMQFWKLEFVPKHPATPQATTGIINHHRTEGPPSARLVCYRDTGDPALIHDIELTDFPFEAFSDAVAEIWVGPTEMGGKRVMVGYIPSEH